MKKTNGSYLHSHIAAASSHTSPDPAETLSA